MFTRTGARPRVLAALTAIVAAAALALLPSLSAAADEGDLATLTAAAAQARADANAAHGAAAAADSDAASAASAASQAHADAGAVCAAVAPATDALAGAPDDGALQQALANAQAACDAANGAAGSADANAGSAAGAASSAHANADALEQAAAAAEAALAAAQSTPAAVQKTTDDETTTEETTDDETTTEEEGTEEEAEEEGTEEEAVEECAEESTDEVITDETAPEEEATTEETTGDEGEEATVEDGCGEAVESLSFDRRQNCDNRDLTFFSQNRNWDWCFPDPKIDIDVDSLCPTVISVEISHLWWWVEYTVTVNGVNQPITVDQWGKASFTVTDFTTGKFEVKVYKGDKKLAWESEWVKDKGCPYISTEITQCTTIGGSADVWVYVSDLQWWRDYQVTITGPGGTVFDDTISWTGSWNDYFSLPPGSYTVTVFSDGDWHKPDIGPVSYTFDVAPCPGDVTISINPTCAPSGSGSLGATLSGLVPGREYSVTVTGPNGTVTDTTFVAAGPTWDVPPSSLPPGTYTVTVVDTASSSGGYALKVAEPEYDPLTWTATGTITSCPALASTGSSPSSGLVPALALIPLGAGLLITSAIRRRKVGPLAEVDEEG